LNETTKKKWDKNYDSCSSDYPSPAEVLRQNQHLLPSQGSALDLACGRGANAICLAEKGLTVSAWDISASALEHLANEATNKGLIIELEPRNISEHPPKPNSFDVITVSNFLERELIDDIRKAIKPDGLIFYQTFIIDKVSNIGPSNPDYLLDNNELLNFFSEWKVVLYREEGLLGNVDSGFRNQAMLIAQKP